jgi:hypothetical protein
MSNVIAAEAWPSIRCTAFTLEPAATARLAVAWRRSCGAARHARLDNGLGEPTRAERQRFCILSAELVDLLLAQAGRRDIRRRQPAPTAPDMRADADQGVKPQPAQPADLRAVNCRLRPSPVCGQVRAGVGPILRIHVPRATWCSLASLTSTENFIVLERCVRAR